MLKRANVVLRLDKNGCEIPMDEPRQVVFAELLGVAKRGGASFNGQFVLASLELLDSRAQKLLDWISTNS